MKKVLYCFLSLVLICNLVIAPVAAAENAYEVIPYAQHVAGDTIIFTDDAGTIVEVKPSDSGSYILAGSGTVILQGVGGAMGSVSAALMSPAVPLIGILLASGYIVYSNPGLVEDVMSVFNLLSDAAREELSAIVSAGLNSFTLADYPALSDELSDVIDSVFYTDDGSFKESGITFDPTNMLEYDFDAQYVFGDELTSSAYKYPLGPGGVVISGTSLSMSLVLTSLFEDYAPDVKHAFKIVNSATGASMFFMPDSSSDFLEKACSTYSFTAPAVQTSADSSGSVVHTLGVWVLSKCSKLAAGEECSVCLMTYESEYYGEHDRLTASTYVCFNGTGADALDNVIFTGQYYGGVRDWQLYRAIPMDGVSTATLPYSAFQTIASDLSYARAIDGTAAIPDEDTPIYIPTEQTFANPNLLTKEGAQTGVWEKETSVPDTDTDAPALDIIGWLSDILDAIKAIPSSIGQVITNVLEYFFVPDLTDVQDVVDVYTAKFGWVEDIYVYMRDIFDGLMADEPPKIPIYLGDAESKYDWGGDAYALDMSWYARYKNSVDTIVSGILWIFFIWRLFRRIPDILAGVGVIEDTVSSSDGKNKLRGGK